MSVVVHLGLATICFLNQCYPALVGETTPPGHFRLTQRLVVSPGYGGDVLVFKEGKTDVFAIHRVWTGLPAQRRVQRLASDRTALRRNVTGGCVNVAPAIYDKLVDCCRGSDLIIE